MKHHRPAWHEFMGCVICRDCGIALSTSPSGEVMAWTTEECEGEWGTRVSGVKSGVLPSCAPEYPAKTG